MIAGVIFDCDGTIVDSRDMIIPFYDWAFAQVGLPPLDTSDPLVIAWALSLSDADVFARVIPSAEDRTRLIDFLSSLDPADFVSELSLEPFALEVMKELRPRYRLGIATNRGPDMQALVRHFGFDAYVDTVVTAAHVRNPKPHPEMLLLAAEQMELAPARILYVGDTEADRDAARAAGMTFVWYQRRRTPEAHPPLPEDGLTLEDLRDLPAMLAQLQAGCVSWANDGDT